MSENGRGRPLTSLKGFIDRIDGLSVGTDEHLFFRDHSNRDKYYIEPSVFRKNDDDAYKGKEVEHILFRELITTNPSEFQSDTSRLERLARMQQHSSPTSSLIGDAVHLAYASYFNIQYLLTWNCNHLANANKRKHIRVINARLGLSTPEIVTPLELFKEEENS